jgi:spore coat protein U-like protein
MQTQKIVGALLLSALAPPAWGLTCGVSATSLVFGAYAPLSGAPLDSSASITIQCSTIASVLLSYTLQLSAGASSSYSMRTMVSGGGHTLNYNVFLDAGRSLVWGNGSGGTGAPGFSAIIAAGAWQSTHVAYARIPAQVTARPGSYGDILMATLFF